MSEWQKLKDVVVKIVGGGTPSRKNDEYYHGDIPWVTVKDLIATSISDAQEKITPQAIQESAANLIPKGNVIIATRMALGKAFINEVDVAINQDLKALIPNKEKIIPKYLLYTYLSNKEKIEGLGSGTTVKGIRLEQVNELKMFVPSLEEQKKITTILSTVDKAIEKTEAIIEKTEKVKKGLMQQLFTKGIGHVKFKKTEIGEIPENWKVIMMGEAIELISGQSSSSNEVNYEHKGIAYVTGPEQWNGYHIEEMKWVENPRKIAKENSIFITVKGSGVGKIFLGGYYAIGRDVMAIVPLESINKDYLYYLVLYQAQQIVSNKVGIVPGISRSDILEFKFGLPKIEEQVRISKLLTNLDEKLTIEKNKHLKLRELKNGLMQSLLTGKVRVKIDETEVTQV
ncbi:hypothetical protein COM64_23130 [Bacillus toyonensis]|uniref:restriction endonuclease subunit S n=1 Tax=Bacillus toyonensis TaxID=155322 RepID=UPI000BF6C864|nr:restriction endonuclease subunit S [Bacillus toyonensis]PGE15009.1 hypothetical protein COM64_23130 [Bacillus toyonensis]